VLISENGRVQRSLGNGHRARMEECREAWETDTEGSVYSLLEACRGREIHHKDSHVPSTSPPRVINLVLKEAPMGFVIYKTIRLKHATYSQNKLKVPKARAIFGV